MVAELRRAGVARGDFVALAVAPGVGLGMATAGDDVSLSLATEDPSTAVRRVEDALHPRWVLWSNDTAAMLAGTGVRIATSWDVTAVHRLLFGGWAADPARVWAELHRLELGTIPTTAPADLFSDPDDGNGEPGEPVRPDGHLRPDWVAGGWRETPHRLQRWAELASTVAALQQARLAQLEDRPQVAATARVESTAELLCAEMSVRGLPMDRAVAEGIIAGFVGPRPRDATEAAEQRARRDAEVLRHAPPGAAVDLRSPGQVKSLLSRVGVEVPDTRAWRLRVLQDAPPLVGALLAWRKAERVGTTYGYGWLDKHLGADGRLRGAWTGCDGAAGRMTASGGLHNMPAEMRAAVVAEPGHVFVRADLGQIEPRVLAAISRDEGLARATAADDMYAPIAAELAVDRATAKVAVLAAMYGQTTGHGAQALRRLETAYPVAMAYLESAARSGQAGRDLRTFGGRLIVMGPPSTSGTGPRETRGAAAARGRYGRNALVQGAAAELFKMWAVTVRSRSDGLGAYIVLCLHDELLVHAPAEHGGAVAQLLDDCLGEAVRRWTPYDAVRFIADIGVIARWSDAKDSAAVPAKDSAAPPAKDSAVQMTETRSVVACAQCQVHWYMDHEPAKCDDPSHTHQRFQVHRHRTAVVLPDGTAVMAVSFDATDPYTRDQPPDYGLYLDRRWHPPWTHDHLDWLDFGVPDDSVQVVAALRTVLDRARAGERVEVGCLGGHGRTGTTLACLAVLTGHPPREAVAWVRANYCGEAVETPEQEAFVVDLIG